MDRPAGLIPLVRCAGAPLPDVGRKAAVLGWAASAGMRTPGGMVVPSAAFWSAVSACGVTERVRYLSTSALRLDPRHVLDLGATVSAALGSPAVAEVAAAWAAAAAWAGVRAPAVCRSSAAMEDGRRAGFPGMYLSVLDLASEDELAAAMVRCWRSVFSADALQYLVRLRVEPVDLSLALIVQPQVAAPWSGVLLGDRADLSDEGPDAVVAGRPATVRAVRTSGGWSGVDGALAGSLEAVHAMAGRLAAHLGAEVEVEVALPDDGGGPVLLQARPVTAPAVERRAVGIAGESVAVRERLTTADYGLVFESDAVVLEEAASPLSHVATLCRELGVPLVTGVAGARSLLGHRVAVDAGAGTVEVVDEDEEPAAPPEPLEAPAPFAIPEAELLLRSLVESGPDRPPAAVAAALAARHTVVPHPVDTLLEEARGAIRSGL